MRFTPSPLLVALAALWTALGIVAAWQHEVVVLWQGGGVLLGAAALADALRQRRRPTPRVQRRLIKTCR